jgi:methionyl-tRNA formyltransferase
MHGSILPGNKGILPFFWTCLYDEVPGITVHEIDEKIDTGNIIYQEKLTDSTRNTIQSLSDILADNCDRYLLNAMDHVEKNISPVLFNKGVESCYRPLPEDTDIAAYTKKIKGL